MHLFPVDGPSRVLGFINPNDAQNAEVNELV